VLNEKPFCKEDYYKRSGFMCGICGDIIETGMPFEKLTCSQCVNDVLKEYFDINGRRYHADCKKCNVSIYMSCLCTGADRALNC
jgi:hypothetical protein